MASASVLDRALDDAGPRSHDVLTRLGQDAGGVGDVEHGSQDRDQDRDDQHVDHGLLRVRAAADPGDAAEDARQILDVDAVAEDHDADQRRGDRAAAQQRQPRDVLVEHLVGRGRRDHGAGEGGGDEGEHRDLPARHVRREPLHRAGDADFDAERREDDAEGDEATLPQFVQQAFDHAFDLARCAHVEEEDADAEDDPVGEDVRREEDREGQRRDPLLLVEGDVLDADREQERSDQRGEDGVRDHDDGHREARLEESHARREVVCDGPELAGEDARTRGQRVHRGDAHHHEDREAVREEHLALVRDELELEQQQDHGEAVEAPRDLPAHVQEGEDGEPGEERRDPRRDLPPEHVGALLREEGRELEAAEGDDGHQPDGEERRLPDGLVDHGTAVGHEPRDDPVDRDQQPSEEETDHDSFHVDVTARVFLRTIHYRFLLASQDWRVVDDP